MIKLFKKSESSLFIMPISADMGLDFCIFLTTWKKSKKSNIYIYIYIYQVRDGQRDDQTYKKETFDWTTTLQANPINQVHHDFFWRDLQIASSLFSLPLTFLSFWVLVLNPRSHIIFYLLFKWLMIKSAPLATTQLHPTVANHHVFIIILSKGQS